MKIKPSAFPSEYDLVTHILTEDPECSTKEIIDYCLERDSHSRISKQSVAWYRSMLRSAGLPIPKLRRSKDDRI